MSQPAPPVTPKAGTPTVTGSWKPRQPANKLIYMALAWLRTVAFRQMLRQPAEYPLDAHSEPSGLPASSPLELREQEQQVLAALRQLPLAQRQVTALVYDQFSYREIAEIIGKSEAAVRKNIERALATMREILGVT